MIMVDSIKALVDRSLEGNCFLTDDSYLRSSHKGTLHLNTLCTPGQKVHWCVKAVDVQTPISIKQISFGSHHLYQPDDAENLDALVWDATVPYPEFMPKTFPYKIVLKIGEGKDSELETSLASLTIVPSNYINNKSH
jgi:hypothetical protein